MRYSHKLFAVVIGCLRVFSGSFRGRAQMRLTVSERIRRTRNWGWKSSQGRFQRRAGGQVRIGQIELSPLLADIVLVTANA